MTNAKGTVVSEKSTIELEDGTTLFSESSANGLATSYDKFSYDPAELLSLEASAGAGAKGAVSAVKTVRETELTRETEYAFSGESELHASASVHNTGASVVDELAGGSLEGKVVFTLEKR